MDFVFDLEATALREEVEERIVDAFYTGVYDDDGLRRALGMLATHFDSPTACLGEADDVHGRWMIGSGPLDATQLTRYAEVSAIDPAPRAFSAIRVCSASTSDRLFSKRERDKSVFINEYMRPAGLDHSLGSPLVIHGGRFALIGIHQAAARRRFDDDDISSLERISPHVARTLQLRRTFLDLKRKESAFEAFIDERDSGLVGLQGGRSVFVNKSARAIAAKGDGLAIDRSGRPVVKNPQAAIRLSALEADVLAGGPGGLARVPRPSGARDFLVRVSRLPSRGERPRAVHGVLYAIHEAGPSSGACGATIAAMLDVPPGPAKVVAALLDGQDLQGYAKIAGITINTVRCHLKSAFARTGAKSQGELMRSTLCALHALGPWTAAPARA